MKNKSNHIVGKQSSEDSVIFVQDYTIARG